jgi:hypothetical protein
MVTPDMQAAMQRKSIFQFSLAARRVLVVSLLCAGIACLGAAGTLSTAADKPGSFASKARAKASGRTLTFTKRVAYQRAIEEVYWRHRIWPKENARPKPSLDVVISQTQIEKKVERYLRKSQLVADQRGWPITASELQAEMERMASHTLHPRVLLVLFKRWTTILLSSRNVWQGL